MSSLSREQSDRLMQHITGIEQLLTAVDEEGADEILDELYMLITKLFEQFPQLDREED
jgi:predicted metal-dependent enzyme (double-stranded beta helix superfamily)